MKKLLFIILFTAVVVFIGSCEKNLEQIEVEQLQTYLANDTLDYTLDPVGFYYYVLQEGTGSAYPTSGSVVRTVYKGTYIDGTIFDQNSVDNPFTFTVGRNEVVTGYDYGVRKITKGGKIKLVIPSSLAYGYYGSGSVPGYTTLVFEVELLDMAK